MSYPKWPDYSKSIFDDPDTWTYGNTYQTKPSPPDWDIIRRMIEDLERQKQEPNYPPFFMEPALAVPLKDGVSARSGPSAGALELAYKTMSSDEKKQVRKLAFDECGSFYHPDQAIKVVPIFPKHIQAVLQKKADQKEAGGV